jgi:hypothetical protein
MKNNKLKDNTLKTIVDMLISNNYYGGGECIEIVKGKNEYADTLKIGFNKIKRLLK